MLRSSELPVRVYRAGQRPADIVSSFIAAWRDIYGARYIIWRLFARDFIAGFRQKVLGYFWLILSPLFGIASFVFMNWTGILNPGDVSVPYPLFVFFGTAMWGLIIASLNTTSGGLMSNADLVMRTNIPRIALAITGMANIAYSICINFVVLMILLVAFRILPAWTAIFYPLSLLPLLVLGMGIGLLLAVIGTVARDISTIVMTGFNLLMFVTPVIYSTNFDNPTLRQIVQINPLAYLVDEPRNIFFLGYVASPLGYALSSLFGLAILAIGMHGFYLIKDYAAERL